MSHLSDTQGKPISASTPASTLWTDPIVEEIHAFRQAHAAQYGYDIEAIMEDYTLAWQVWQARTITDEEYRRAIAEIPNVQPDDHDKLS